MHSYANLPDSQHRLQQTVDKFNADEAFWQKLEKRRRLRRTTLKRLTREQRHALDLLEFAFLRPLDDCIGLEEKI